MKTFSEKFINSLNLKSAVRLTPEKGFYPLRAGFAKKEIKESSRSEFSQPHYAVVYLISGKGLFHSSDGTSYEIGPGSVFQRFPNDLHSVEFHGDQDLLWAYIGVPESVAETLTKTRLISQRQPVLFIGCQEKIVEQYLSLISKISIYPEMQLATLVTEIQQFIIDLISSVKHGKDEGDEERIVEKACQLLKCDINQRIDIEEVAKTLNIGYSKFRKLFRKTLGISPGQYRINHRIEKSCEILRTSNKTIENVSKSLGYADIATFSKQFKKITGLTPKNYQQSFDQ